MSQTTPMTLPDGLLDEPDDSGYSSGRFFGVLIGVLVGALLLAGFFAPQSNVGFASAAAVLTMVGTVAVGIERVLEVVWSLVDSADKYGGWWPLNQVRRRILQVEDRTRALLQVPVEGVVAALETARNEIGDAGDLTGRTRQDLDAHIAALQEGIPRLSAKVDNAARLAPGSPRLELVRQAKNDAFELFDRAAELVAGATDQVDDAVKTIADQADRLEDIIESFADNPARRIASALIGATLGVAVAGFLGLNLFLAIPESGAEGGADATQDVPDDAPLAGVAGILLTGVVTGLGATPTHEVIKALQRAKRRRSADTAAVVEVTDDQPFAAFGGTRLVAGPPRSRAGGTPAGTLARSYGRPRSFRPTE